MGEPGKSPVTKLRQIHVFPTPLSPRITWNSVMLKWEGGRDGGERRSSRTYRFEFLDFNGVHVKFLSVLRSERKYEWAWGAVLVVSRTVARKRSLEKRTCSRNRFCLGAVYWKNRLWCNLRTLWQSDRLWQLRFTLFCLIPRPKCSRICRTCWRKRRRKRREWRRRCSFATPLPTGILPRWRLMYISMSSNSS